MNKKKTEDKDQSEKKTHVVYTDDPSYLKINILRKRFEEKFHGEDIFFEKLPGLENHLERPEEILSKPDENEKYWFVIFQELKDGSIQIFFKKYGGYSVCACLKLDSKNYEESYKLLSEDVLT